jgi:hypothetical protein
MAMPFSADFEPWVLRIGRSHHGRHGRTDVRRGLSDQIRRDYLDHVAVFGERHLRHLLKSYQKYYNEARTHLSLEKDTPIP